MGASEHVTYCRICEPLCGMVATVEDGRVLRESRMAHLSGVPVRIAPGAEPVASL